MGNKHSSGTIEEQLLKACSQSNGTATLRRLLGREDLPENFTELRLRDGGYSLLALACKAGCVGNVRLLLDNGAPLTQRSDDGCTVLHHACEGASSEVVDLLLERGADPTALNLAGETAMDIAHWKDSSTLLRTMERRISLFSGTVTQEHSTKLQSGLGLLMGQELKESMLNNFGGELKKRWLVVTKVRGTMEMATRGQIVCPRCGTQLREPSEGAQRLVCTCRNVFSIPPRRPGVINTLSIYKSSQSARPIAVYVLENAQVKQLTRNTGQFIVTITVMTPTHDSSNGVTTVPVDGTRTSMMKKVLRFIAPSNVVSDYLAQSINKPFIQIGRDHSTSGGSVPIATPITPPWNSSRNTPLYPSANPPNVTQSDMEVATVVHSADDDLVVAATAHESCTETIACPHCTFLNSISLSQCEMCEMDLSSSAPSNDQALEPDSNLAPDAPSANSSAIESDLNIQHSTGADPSVKHVRRTSSTPTAQGSGLLFDDSPPNSTLDTLPKAPPLPPRPDLRRRSTDNSTTTPSTLLGLATQETLNSDVNRRQSMPASFAHGSQQACLGGASILEESEEELEAFLCPITSELMADPVLTMDGMTYERSAILDWFARGNTTSPMTGVELTSMSLTPNIALRQAIEQHKASIQHRHSLGSHRLVVGELGLQQ